AYGMDFVWELAQKETLSEFMECLKEKGSCPSDSEAEVLMAALYPLKGQKRELSEEDLDVVNGGGRSFLPTKKPSGTSVGSHL
ncbi:MAG: hypothetical protein LUI85_13925, partial [Bacteroides sp.]|nr:hypothetical protein [Bacteroides sp.]